MAAVSDQDSSVVPLPEQPKEDKKALKPSEIVSELDRFIIGQKDAKRAVAIAMRNRWRRHRLDPSLKDEVVPKNILMIGPTGVGKTEIARRLAKIANAPFIKAEATKFTEVGFHGRDVDTIIKDLVEEALSLLRNRRREQVKGQIAGRVDDKILDALLGKGASAREQFRHHLKAGLLDNQEVDVDLPLPRDTDSGVLSFLSNAKIIRLGGPTVEKRRMKIGECRPLLEDLEAEKLLSTEDLTKEAIRLCEEDGIVFIDEIDKIATPAHQRHGPDASAEGVQRDLLPLIEGCSISTKYGNVNTDHILFIASGAFHQCKPSDLLSELQGRLPIRVELKDLTEEDLFRILTEPENNLIKQQVQLLKTEGVEIIFEESAIREIARVTKEVNTTVENIGARRLHTVIERIVDDFSFGAPDLPAGSKFVVTVDMVTEKVGGLMKRGDMKRFII